MTVSACRCLRPEECLDAQRRDAQCKQRRANQWGHPRSVARAISPGRATSVDASPVRAYGRGRGPWRDSAALPPCGETTDLDSRASAGVRGGTRLATIAAMMTSHTADERDRAGMTFEDEVERWAAVVRRDARADGHFVYSVTDDGRVLPSVVSVAARTSRARRVSRHGSGCRAGRISSVPSLPPR